MAQLPSIATTAARRLLPSADLRIEGGSPAAFGAAIGEGVEALGQGVQRVGSALAQFELAKQQEAERAAEFDRQAQFVEFGAAEDERLAESSRDIQGPAIDFTKNFMGSFDERSKEFLEKVPERNRDQWRAKFAALRSSVAGATLKTEFGQRDAWSKTTLDGATTKLLNGIAQSPDALESYRDQGEALIDASLLPAQDKADLKLRWRSNAAVAAATGDVELDPEGALKRLGGVPPTMRDSDDPAPSGSTSGGGGVPSTERSRPNGALSGNLVAGLMRRGFTAAQARGVAAGIAAEASNNPVAFNPKGGGNGAYGLGQWRGPRLAELRKRYGSAPSVEQQLDFLAYELRGGDAGGKKVLSKADEVAVLHSYIHDFMRPAKGYETTSDMKRGLSALGRRVVAKAEATTQRLRQPEPGKSYNVEDAILELGMTAPQAEAFVKTGKVPEGAEVAVTGAVAVQGDTEVEPLTEAPEIDPRYADLPLSARMQLIGAAQRQIEQRAQIAAAEQQEDHAGKLNTLLLDLNDGKAGRADIDAAREAGWLTDYAEVERAESIVDARDKGNDALNNFNAMMGTPGFTFNQLDDDQQKAVEAGVKAHGGTPQAAFEIWQKTGILAGSGAVALRGGLISTDANRVAGAATIASNMLEQNPNAFAGVEGGEEIERTAMLYRHYVADLGKTPEEATALIARRNDPSVKRTIDANAIEERDFKKAVNKHSTQIDSWLSNQYGGWLSIDPSFVAPEQKAAVRQDFSELAWDHYREFKDEGAARSYAGQQIKKLYGPVNGRIMKYPPTRAYPPINGGHEYIFEQAAGDIKQVAGRKIDPKNVYLMPLPTRTAEAFRAGKQVPYAVHYIDEVNGQKVYRVLSGQAFVADVGAARSGEQRGRQTRFEAERRSLITRRKNPVVRRGRDY